MVSILVHSNIIIQIVFGKQKFFLTSGIIHVCTPVLRHLILVLTMSPVTNPNDFVATPYDECNRFQSRSTELVIFSPTAGEFVTIAWSYPLSFFSFGFSKLMSQLQADSTWSPNRGPWHQVMAP